MNPQFMNQGLGGYGQPAPGPGQPYTEQPGMGPPRPPQGYNNGPNQQFNRPQGPGGYMKPGPPGSLQNGPGSIGPPTGDPFAHQRMATVPPVSQYGGPQINQMSNDMSSMHISGQQPRQPMPPNSMTRPPNAMGAPPNSMARPPSSVAGGPMAMPINSMAGPPFSMAGPQVPIGGQPVPIGGQPVPIGGQPVPIGGPPMSLAGGPPTSGVPPRLGQPGAGIPPTSMGYGGLPSAGHRPPMGGPQPGPPTSISQMNGPASVVNGPPVGAGQARPPVLGQPTSMGGQPGMGAPLMSMAVPTMGPPHTSMVGTGMAGPPNSMPGPGMSPRLGGPPTSVSGHGMAGHHTMGGPPASMPSTGMAGNPMAGGPPTSMAGHSMAGVPPTSMAGHPMAGGPPTSMAGYPMAGGPPTSMAGHPMSTAGHPMSAAGPPMMGGPPTFMPGTEVAGGPMMGGPPMSMAGPPMMGGPPTSLAGTGMAGPPMMGGPPTSMMPGMVPGPMPMTGQQQPVVNAPSAGGMQMGMPPPSPGGMPIGQHPGGQYPGIQPGVQPGAQNQPYGQRPMPSPGPMAAPQQQQPRKLDPDHMPSPIQVIEDDKRSKGGLFQTGQRGTVPPLVTTNFIAEDQGNSSPRFIRSTMYNIPCTGDMLKQSHIPLSVNITPFARLHPKEPPPPLVDFGEVGPVRCNRCKAYMCPNMLFIDGGRRFQCCFCSCATDVPTEYFNHLDHTGRRIDFYQRPELSLGTYEFVATKDYCKESTLQRIKNGKPPMAPGYIFMLDVSYNSVKSGLVRLLCSQMKEVLQGLPKETGTEHSNIRVGFVTYAKQIHFYNVKGSLAQPQMLVVSDIQDVFVPLLDGFLVTLQESEAVIDSLMEQIPVMFADSRETEIVLGPVIQAGMDALQSAEATGKLFIFHSSLPIADAPGKLKNRDDRKLLGTDKEKTLLTPQNTFYTKLGQEAVAVGCSVDLFLFNNSYIDVATIGEVTRLTGGQIYKYLYFQADLDAQRFMEDLKNNVQRQIAFDAIMRVRTSTGIRPVDFLGNYYMSNTTDVELAAIDCDKSVNVEIKHDDKLSEADGAFLQAAVLYTTINGDRRLRIVNLAFNCCMQMADLFRNCELDMLVNHMAKVAIRSSMNTTPKQVRETLMTQCASILACYRKNCASPSSAGQLILPECMKLLPVYTNCIIKSACLQGGADTQTDERSYLMNLVNSMNVRDTCVFFYPRLLPLHELDLESTTLPVAIRCSYERLKENGVYILENGLITYLWIGMNVSHEWVQDVFGVQSVAQIDIDKTQLHDLDNPLSRRVRTVFKKVREDRHRHMKLVIVRQRDKLEPVFQQYLMEDRGANGSSSYVDFLCHIHKEIRNLLS